MGYVSRHIFKWFGLSLILLNDGEQLIMGSETLPPHHSHRRGGILLSQCCQIISQ